jgi:hypothetical protein
MQPLGPRKAWRAITLATLLLVPAFWLLLAGLVSAAEETEGGVANPGAAIAGGLSIIPFVFIALALLSEHPNVPRAVLRAMGLCLLVGLVVSVVALDGVTGIVAGVGAGGIAALRADHEGATRPRALAVVVAASYTFVLVRVAGPIVLLSAPAFPFTALGLADLYVVRSRSRIGLAEGDGGDTATV